MAVIYVDVEQRSKYIMLGEQGEKNAVVVKFDISTWLSAFGSGGSAFVDVERPGDATAYTKQIELEGSYAVWSVDDIDNAVAGKGKVQLTYLMPGDDGRSKTATFAMMVDKSLDASGDVPDPYESYLEEAREIRAETTQNAQTAQAAAQAASTKAGEASTSASEAYTSARSAKKSEENAERSASTASEAAEEILGMTATAQTLPEGSEATVDYSNGVMAFGIPRGDKGAKGDKGDTGETGATPQMSIGTVETLAPDEDATATITGTAENPVLNLGLPKGETGDVSKAELASLMPLETVSGSVASFSDGSAVFDAEQAVVTLEPVQDLHGYDKPWIGGAGKNKANIDGATNLTGMALSNGVLANTLTDGENRPALYVATYRGSTLVERIISAAYSPTVGRYSGRYTINNTDFDRIRIWHSGSTQDLSSFIPCSVSATGDYVLSINFLGVAPDVVGGFSFKEVQFEAGSTATSYEPYSNICPISGHTEVVTSLSPYEQTGKHTITGKNLYNAPNNQNGVLVPCHIENGLTVVASCGGRGAGIRYYNANKTQMDYWTLALQANGRYYRSFTASGGIEYVKFYGANSTDYMIEVGANTPSDYEPYGYSYTTDLGRTVYGGTLDVVSGELVVDRAMVDLGTLNWTYYSAGSTSDKAIFYTPLAGAVGKPNSNVANCMAEKYKTDSVNGVLANVGGIGISNNSNPPNVWVSTSSQSDTPSGQLCYELATPQTYQLTPQQIALLTGDNNVWSADGSIEVKYRANIGLYVDKKISEVNA